MATPGTPLREEGGDKNNHSFGAPYLPPSVGSRGKLNSAGQRGAPQPLNPKSVKSSTGGHTIETMLDHRYSGWIKSFVDDKGFGFIESEEVFAQFGRDAFLHKAQYRGLSVGMSVDFYVALNKMRHPQARQVEPNGKPDRQVRRQAPRQPHASQLAQQSIQLADHTAAAPPSAPPMQQAGGGRRKGRAGDGGADSTGGGHTTARPNHQSSWAQARTQSLAV